MSVLRELTVEGEPTGREVPLRERMLVGRAPHCDLCLPARKVSGEHAVLRWVGQGWTLRDLSSRNGTWTAHTRLDAGGSLALRPGDQLCFGSAAVRWELGEGPPGIFAVADDGTVVRGDDGLLALPSAEAPVLTVYQDTRGRWVVDRDGEAEPVASDAAVELDGRSWRLALPQALPPTEEGELVLEELAFDFGVSGDEEYVELTVRQGSSAREIPPRAHLYVLLTLARLRLEQAAEDTIGEAGWIHQEDLARMLACNDAYINLAVFKVRKQLAKAGVVGAPGVVERRRGTRQLRFCSERVTVRVL